VFDFNGQTAIVTGGTRGIGRSIVEGFLRSGARVIIPSIEEATEEFRQENKEFADNIDVQMCDVSKYEDVEKFFDYVDKQYEGFEILVNNAGIRKDAVLAMMKESEWQDVVNVNLSGVFYMCKQAVMRLSRKRYGRIVSITSPSGKFGFEGQANYAATKAGLVALSRSLSKEVARRNITVNCVSPGFIDTELLRDLPQELRDSYTATVPVKRFGQPDEVAYCVLFLASREAAYINGATLEVTGGL
jgi:3-oxoacyl-[acyl-carrier protein] reductase